MIDLRTFFDGWHGIVRTIVVGVSTYIGLVALLRISGKRTLAKMNAFDLVVTVALGSTFASVLTSRDAMRRERVTEDDIDAAARDSGVSDRSHIEALILETDGSFSVIGRNS